MYINPVTKPAAEAPKSEKRKKGAGESSFVEQVETLLELDAVDIARRFEDGEERKEAAKRFRAPHDEESADTPDNKNQAESDKAKTADKSLNITV
ncbi:MAG TPA: hypothetical protein PLP17_01890 [Oligoflexia bacterium]|nr:hypothetical protein [Oligoflexia bacterium]